MHKRNRLAYLGVLSLLAVGAGNWACSSSPGRSNGGAGGEEETGGSGVTGGKGGSTTGGKGGSATGGSPGTGGSTGGSPGTGGSPATGGSPGTGGSGTGGSTGGSGGGGSGGAPDGGAAPDGGGGGDTGPLVFNAIGLNPSGFKMYMAPSFTRAQSNGGGNHSPAMEWSGEVPAGTKSWAITLIDTNKTVQAGQPVVPNTFVKVHFSYYDIPLATRSLKADLPRTAMIPEPAGMRASATFSGNGWFGPGAGPPPHIYVLSLWALNVEKLAGAGAQQATYDAIVKAAIGKPVTLVVVGTNAGI